MATEPEVENTTTVSFMSPIIFQEASVCSSSRSVKSPGTATGRPETGMLASINRLLETPK